jgi:hypothetical protein
MLHVFQQAYCVYLAVCNVAVTDHQKSAGHEP